MPLVVMGDVTSFDQLSAEILALLTLVTGHLQQGSSLTLQCFGV